MRPPREASTRRPFSHRPLQRPSRLPRTAGQSPRGLGHAGQPRRRGDEAKPNSGEPPDGLGNFHFLRGVGCPRTHWETLFEASMGRSRGRIVERCAQRIVERFSTAQEAGPVLNPDPAGWDPSRRPGAAASILPRRFSRAGAQARFTWRRALHGLERALKFSRVDTIPE